MYVVSEDYTDTLAGLGKQTIDQIRNWTYEVLLGLRHLHSHGITHRNLSLSNIYLHKGSVKLSEYALFSIASGHVDFPIGDPLYFAPELVEAGCDGLSSCKTDVWALGILILELYFGREAFGVNMDDIDSVLDFSLRVKSEGLESLGLVIPFDDLSDFVRMCLDIDARTRPTVERLLHHAFLASCPLPPCPWTTRPYLPLKRALPEFRMSWKDLMYFWRMNGGDIESFISSNEQSTYSIHTIPSLVLSTDDVDEKIQGSLNNARQLLYSPAHESMKQLSLETFWLKIEAIERGLIRSESGLYHDDWKEPVQWNALHLDSLWNSNQTRIMLNAALKNKDFGYQYQRMKLFYRLLLEFPASRDQIIKEATYDIPILFRGRVWAALLGVEGDAGILYESFDKDNLLDIDRQLDLDIPRCHQYNELLSSPIGHQKLKRVLKSWILAEKSKLVYWQGLDSLAAVFVTLNFHDEALAFASMRLFTTKFCQGFYIPDNSKVMREYMLSFRTLLAFHQPKLAQHLYTIGLGPELYAISWFMTLYAHIFSLEKIYIIWDHILTNPSTFFFMFMGVSILSQLKDQLFDHDFNHAMLVFSELPSLDFESCVVDALLYSKTTPPSLLAQLQTFTETVDCTAVSSDPKRFSFLSTKRTLVGVVSSKEAKEMKKWSLFIDLRPRHEFQKGHVPHSVWLPLSTLTIQPIQSLLTRAKFILLVTNDVASIENMVTLLSDWSHVAVLNGDSVERVSNAESCSCDCDGTLVKCLKI